MSTWKSKLQDILARFKPQPIEKGFEVPPEWSNPETKAPIVEKPKVAVEPTFVFKTLKKGPKILTFSRKIVRILAFVGFAQSIIWIVMGLLFAPEITTFAIYVPICGMTLDYLYKTRPMAPLSACHILPNMEKLEDTNI